MCKEIILFQFFNFIPQFSEFFATLFEFFCNLSNGSRLILWESLLYTTDEILYGKNINPDIMIQLQRLTAPSVFPNPIFSYFFYFFSSTTAIEISFYYSTIDKYQKFIGCIFLSHQNLLPFRIFLSDIIFDFPARNNKHGRIFSSENLWFFDLICNLLFLFKLIYFLRIQINFSFKCHNIYFDGFKLLEWNFHCLSLRVTSIIKVHTWSLARSIWFFSIFTLWLRLNFITWVE